MRKVRTQKFGGKKYLIEIDPIDGAVTHGHPTIFISAALNTQKGLTTVIHEAGHASCPNLSEETIKLFSENAGRLAWRLGFRIEDKNGRKKRTKKNSII